MLSPLANRLSLAGLGIIAFGLCACSEKENPDAQGAQAAEPALDDAPLVKQETLPDVVTFNAHIRPIFSDTCFACHGDTAVSGGVIPDLRYTSQATHALWNEIVLGGLLKSGGMASYASILSEEDASAIQAYVIKRAYDAKAEVMSQ